MTDTPTARFPTDDGPDGDGPDLEVSAGGNGDWYVAIVTIDDAGLRHVSDAVRFCTSGARDDTATMLVAALHAAIVGDGKTLAARCEAAVALYRGPQ